MVMQKVQQAKTIRLNAVQALRRAFLHRGWVFRSSVAPKAIPQPDSTVLDKPAANKKPKKQEPTSKGVEKENKTDESYPERVSEGESDKDIEAKDEEGKDKLKSEVEGSKTAKGPEDLKELAEKSQDVLYEATTVWPFTLFPDTIKLDREKLTIANRAFWRVANITSVPVGEIMSAEVVVGPFFGSLHLTFRFFANNERRITFLWRHDAVEMQRLIHGYIIAHRREIDISSVNKKELIKLLTELGQGASD